MAKKHIHIIGGGLAGLSAAVTLSQKPNTKIIIYESSPACGGRARSFYDASLDRVIDNGNHLILSGNEAVFQYLTMLDSVDSLQTPGYPLFPFVDLEENKRWDILLSRGKIPWWLFFSKRRVPDVRFPELMALWNLIKANRHQTVADCLVNGQFARRLLQPFAVSALNTSCDAGSATLLGSVVKQSLMKGGKACIPYFAREGLSETFVKPALSLIQLQGGEVHTKSRLTSIHLENNQIDYFVINDQKIELAPDDKIILAVNAHVAEPILTLIYPKVMVPNQFESILNLHYAVSPDMKLKGSLDKAHFIGVIGGVSEWIFIKKGVISVTVSAANRFAGCNHQNLALLIWQEIRAVLNPSLYDHLSTDLPTYRLLWEKRASFTATIEQDRRRPSYYTAHHNLFLAGDWISTGL